MLDINKAINDRAGHDRDPQGHMYDLAPWSYKTAQFQARAEGLGDLTDQQWQAIRLLRCLYRKNGRAASARQLIGTLGKSFAAEGGSHYLYRLFPQGPIDQGSRLAGIPAPP